MKFIHLAFPLLLASSTYGQTIVGFSFSSDNLVPEILDSHLSVENAVGETILSFPETGTARFTSGDPMIMSFSFDVVIEAGYEMDLTSLFVGQEGQKFASGKIASLSYDTGSGPITIGSTEHQPQDIDVGAGHADFEDNTITVSGLTGTVTFVYSSTTNRANDRIEFNDFNLGGTVSAIPEPGHYALMAGVAGLGLLVLRRRR